jgi:hypothetical protein
MPKAPTKTYDSKCWDLAEVFLSDEPHLSTTDRIEALAVIIQEAIEDFITTEQSNYEPRETGDAWAGGFADNH